jgi:Ca2+-binding EF-hand superfamily protein
MMDENESGDLGPSEWDEAFNAYFSGLDYDKDTAFKDWDVDQDGTLTSEEIKSALEETDYYDKWDHNNNDRIDENEFAESTFTTWDTDGDGFVQAEEYSKWYDKYNRF